MSRFPHYLLMVIVTGWAFFAQPNTSHAVRKGDFDISSNSSAIPVEEIHSGGPPKDGIPSIDKPVFLSPDKSPLQDQDRVLGLMWNGVAKAYPINIMNWHEIVNDQFGKEPVVITYCPLCGSGVAFEAQVGGEALQFGVSGLLYNSDVLLYDRKTESLWSQLLSRAVTGKMKGTRLRMLPLMVTTWAEWQQLYPETVVLSRDTGHFRDYDRDPYAGYETSQGIYFPVSKKDPRYHPKEQVIGLEIKGQFKAYPVAELSLTQGTLKDEFAGQVIRIEYNPVSQSARFFDQQGIELAVIRTFWFAWYAFHPETAVYKP